MKGGYNLLLLSRKKMRGFLDRRGGSILIICLAECSAYIKCKELVVKMFAMISVLSIFHPISFLA